MIMKDDKELKNLLDHHIITKPIYYVNFKKNRISLGDEDQ